MGQVNARFKILVLNNQDINDVLTDILNRLDKIEKEIGLKPVEGTMEYAIENLKSCIGSLGITAEEAGRTLQNTMQKIYNSLGSNAEVLEKKENILYKFKNGEYITTEDWSWLDKDDTNE